MLFSLGKSNLEIHSLAANFHELQVRDIRIAVYSVAFASTLLHCTNGRFTSSNWNVFTWSVRIFLAIPLHVHIHESDKWFVDSKSWSRLKPFWFLKRRDLYRVKFFSLSSSSHSPTVTTFVAFLSGYCRFLAFSPFVSHFISIFKWNYAFQYKRKILKYIVTVSSNKSSILYK